MNGPYNRPNNLFKQSDYVSSVLAAENSRITPRWGSSWAAGGSPILPYYDVRLATQQSTAAAKSNTLLYIALAGLAIYILSR